MESLIKKAGSVEQAISDALQELNIEEKDAEIEVINKGGIFSQAEVKVTKKSTPIDLAKDFVSGLLLNMGLDCSVEIGKNEDSEFINIAGKDNGIAIGYRGEVLDAIQYITMLAVNKNNDENNEYSKIMIDSESYRQKRVVTLTDLANRLAIKVIKTGRQVELEPMNPFERRVVHTALQDNEKVITESMGVEPRRFVVIKPTNPIQTHSTAYNNFKKNGPRHTRSFGGGNKRF